MKFLILLMALVGFTAAALPDSATQGPNPQDIATPEPEYIDIDEPLPAPAPRPVAAPAPRPIAAPAPIIQARSSSISIAAPRPIARPVQSYVPPQRSYQPAIQNQLPGHSFSSHSGYQYRRPVYIRRFYRRRF